MIKNLNFKARGEKMGEFSFDLRATELADIVMQERTPQAARAYLGWIAWLGPNFYKPPTQVFKTALDLAVLDMENAGLSPREKIPNYEYWKRIASLYENDVMEIKFEQEIRSYKRQTPE